MTPEQEIRAVAIQAAAAFCAPIGYVEGGKIHSPEDVLLVADVFVGYIEGGWERALRINASGDKNQAAPAPENPKAEAVRPVQDVELREQEASADGGAFAFDPDPVTIPQIAPEPARSAPAATAEASEGEDSMAAALGTVSPIQGRARQKIDRIKRERADKLVTVARTAKAPEHKARLYDAAESAGLLDFRMEIDGKLQAVGSYLQSL